MEKLTIGKVAKAAGVSVETVRFYEKRGLIDRPPTKQGAFRTYPHTVINRIRFIQRVREIGFSLDEAAELCFILDSESFRSNELTNTAVCFAAATGNKIRFLQHLKTSLQNWLNGTVVRGTFDNPSSFDLVSGDQE
jgi:MerR family mercuric resistance operon transcriptional regulator